MTNAPTSPPGAGPLLYDLRVTDREPGELADVARWADEHGVATVWAPEATHDPFVQLALIGAGSSRCHIGTGIAVAFGRSPFSMAHVSWDLQQLSNGRFELGLGTQIRAHVERRYSQPWYGAASALRDYVACCRHIWRCWQTGVHEPYEGRFFQFTLSNPEFEPEPLPADQATIPVWFGAVGPKMAQLAGEAADGVHVHAFHSEQYLRQQFWPIVTEAALSAGRDPASLRASCPVMAGVAHDDAERAELMSHFRRHLAFYGSTPAYLPVLESVDAGDLHAKLHAMSREKRWRDMEALISDETVEQFALIDEPLPLAQKLRRRYSGVLTNLSLYRGADRFMRDDEWAPFIAALAAPEPARA